MVYLGDYKEKQCMNFISKEVNIIIDETEDYIEISLSRKETKELIGKITCFFYNYRNPYQYKNSNSMHIKRLMVDSAYTRKGIGTYLVKEVILFAERKKYKNITVNPSAATWLISQEELEKFYKKFLFCTSLRKKQIEFKIIID